MSSDEDSKTLQERKIRFRAQAKPPYGSESNIEELLRNELANQENDKKKVEMPSLMSFLRLELTRDYQLEYAEERFSARRDKIYSFMKIPKEVERFMRYGFMQCTDSFLFVYTFLPIRVVLALYALVTRSAARCFGWSDPKLKTVLSGGEVCDLLKAVILVTCTIALLYVDTNMLYHLIKSQSVIKLYIFFNMLEIGDRLFSAFGQDAIDALLWTATEPRGRKREHLGTVPHLIFAIVYVILHSILVLFQVTTLNVAINSRNKALMTIMMSNNFVELKGSVFKKFDKNNLFQVSCSDVRERFHLITLLFIVILQTMREYNWKTEHFWIMLPDCIAVLVAEMFVDWIKHAFITRFNELHLDVYRDYTTSLAYDVAQTRQRFAFSDHSDLVARRMGFIPLPLGVVVVRVLISSITVDDFPSVMICFVAYLFVSALKVLNRLVIVGMACDLITQHKQEKATLSSPISNRCASPMPGNRNKTDTATSPLRPQADPITNGRMASLLARQATSYFPPSAIFENSNVDLKNASLNDELLKIDGDDIRIETFAFEDVTRSFPNIKSGEDDDGGGSELDETLKRSESEPNLNKTESDSSPK